jgi:hypothetical protein
MMKKFLMFFLALSFSLQAGVTLTESQDVSNPLDVIFMADTQIHNILAPPHFYRNIFIDNLLEITVRPPHLDLFSTDFLKWTLSEYGEGKKIIFLGDALNIACKNEWSKFRQSMDKFKTHAGWVMAPGNHDAFFYGNTNGSRSNERGVSKKWWATACQEGLGQPIPERIKDIVMAKDDLVTSYLDVLFDQSKTNPAEFPISKKEFNCKTHADLGKVSYEKNVVIKDCEWNSSNEESFLQKVFYATPESDDIRYSYKALIVQELNLGINLKGILMDTYDYEGAPTLLIGALNNGKERRLSKSLNAGLKGSFQKRQIEVVERWISGKNNTFFLLMGHHPLEDLSEKSIKLLTELKKIHPNLAYVSAHTHSGFLNQKGIIPEVNIGSMIDWNPGFVTMGSEIKDGVLSLEVKRTHFDEELLNCNPVENYGGYTDYKKMKNGTTGVFDFTMDLITKSFEKVYASLDGQEIKSNDSSPCSKRDTKCLQGKFLLAKEAMNEDSFLQDNFDFFTKRISYGACQALWASKAEHELTLKK